MRTPPTQPPLVHFPLQLQTQHVARAGFLGAGKTTLLNYILSDPDHGLKIAVIENEFGSVAIDHALVKVRCAGSSDWRV